ncbi:hypothetical protein KBX06_25195 [Micromonospora sp. C31]|uniref:hypothetical protein n=1 Tax=Micromonospora sp. C31 TaxID=2824876 RepID=UPI001B37F6AD|nr:hypothetical protein [Micromonospora sp. C31]MBQ1076426.1 hypothetical protein [Micromonospora sp. C31]
MSISLDILVTVMIKRSHGGAMADDAAVPMAADAEGLPDTVAAGLQSQIDDLTATLEHHQRLFESLRARGLLPTDPDNGRP